MYRNQQVTITKNDTVMNKFKGLSGTVKSIDSNGCEIEFQKSISKNGQTTAFFRFDQIVFARNYPY